MIQKRLSTRLSGRMNRLPGGQSGVALLIALSLALVMSGMAMAILAVSATERETGRGELAAARARCGAEAAIEIARQQMVLFSKAKMDSLRSAWSGNGPIITDPQAFFPAGGLCFRDEYLDIEMITTFEFADSQLAPAGQVFDFDYAVVSRRMGEGAPGEEAYGGDGVFDGSLRLGASMGSFTDYLIFTDIHVTPAGRGIWFHTGGRLDGRRG